MQFAKYVLPEHGVPVEFFLWPLFLWNKTFEFLFYFLNNLYTSFLQKRLTIDSPSNRYAMTIQQSSTQRVSAVEDKLAGQGKIKPGESMASKGCACPEV